MQLFKSPTIGRYIELDDISSSFNGSNVTFNLTVEEDTLAVTPQTDANAITMV